MLTVRHPHRLIIDYQPEAEEQNPLFFAPMKFDINGDTGNIAIEMTDDRYPHCIEAHFQDAPRGEAFFMYLAQKPMLFPEPKGSAGLDVDATTDGIIRYLLPRITHHACIQQKLENILRTTIPRSIARMKEDEIDIYNRNLFCKTLSVYLAKDGFLCSANEIAAQLRYTCTATMRINACFDRFVKDVLLAETYQSRQKN